MEEYEESYRCALDDFDGTEGIQLQSSSLMRVDFDQL